MNKLYAVRKGKIKGIYENWNDCKQQVDNFPGAIYKSFTTIEEAAEFMGWTQKSKGEDVDISEAETITAYVDGSYNIATGEYGYGAVLLKEDEEIKISNRGNDPELASMRNVAGEIKGSEAAIIYAYENKYKKVIIYYDYEGISKWCLGLWKTNKKGTIEYKKFYDEMIKKIKIEFVKVKGHSGDKYNDMADELAKKAAGVL